MTDTVISSATKEVVIGFDRPFVIIGERINPTGRKIMAAEMMAGDYSRVIADALAQQNAGATLIVIEAVPSPLAAEATRQLHIPTIGIGAGKECSGQVLVLHDMLNVSPGKKARFVRNFMAGQDSITAAIAAYVVAVKDGSFPGPEHCY